MEGSPGYGDGKRGRSGPYRYGGPTRGSGGADIGGRMSYGRGCGRQEVPFHGHESGRLSRGGRGGGRGGRSGGGRGGGADTSTLYNGLIPSVPQIPAERKSLHGLEHCVVEEAGDVPPRERFGLGRGQGSGEHPAREYPFELRKKRQGAVGTLVKLRTNHCPVIPKNLDLVIHRYDITMQPVVTTATALAAAGEQEHEMMPPKETCSALYKELVRQGIFEQKAPAYDRQRAIYSVEKLPFESKELEVPLVEGRRTRTWKVALHLTGSLPITRLKQYLDGATPHCPQDILQALDIACRQEYTEKYVAIGASLFHPIKFGSESLGSGIMAVQGFYQSLRPVQAGLSLNIDTSVTAFYTATPVDAFLCDFLNYRNLDLEGIITNNEAFQKASKTLKGLAIDVAYPHGAKRRFKLAGLSKKTARTAHFMLASRGDTESSQETTVEQYYLDTYGKNVRPHLPCLEVKKGKRGRETLLPMEMCTLAIGQRYSRKLNEQQITKLLEIACVSPDDRANTIEKIVRENEYNANEMMKDFGLSVRQPAQITGRHLDPPPILFGLGGQRAIVPGMGVWNLRGKHVVNGVRISKWLLVNLAASSEVNGSMAQNFANQLAGMAKNTGMTMAPCAKYSEGSPYSAEHAIREAYSQGGKDLDIIVVIMPTKDNKQPYDTVKRVCETDIGVVTQCVLAKHIERCAPQYLANVVIKINAKLGGRNQLLVQEAARKIPKVSDVPTCIMGADVSHPPPFDSSQPSIAAMVATVDWPCVNKFVSLTSAQQSRQEIIQEMYNTTRDAQGKVEAGGMARELLQSFVWHTGKSPQRIILYRDGVSEGQFQQVLDYELTALRRACKSLGLSPKITFIVVNKRHHTRFFPVYDSERDNSGNVRPGTVVDVAICHPTEYDFYLCSHAGIQGTSRPVHYHVLYDENDMGPDDLQTLTNNLCYTYARCTRSVAVVPAANYAHRAAMRGRCWIDSQSDASSESSGGSGVRGRISDVQPLPTIKGRVAEGMFYC